MSQCFTPLIRYRQVLNTAATAVVAGALLGACSSMPMPGNLQIPANDPSFRNRVYTGLSIGSSRLEPDTNGTVFTVDNTSDSGTQLRLGVDVHNMLSLELDTSVLGTATLTQANTDVKYSSFAASALIYGLGGAQMRSRREGWSAYGRLGYGILKKSSAVVPLESSDSQLTVGLGAEFGFGNGIGIRGELTRFDSDAMFFGLGAIYRFGLTPRQVGSAIASAVEPALRSTNTRVAAGGRTLPGPGASTRQDKNANSSRAAAPTQTNPYGGFSVPALAARTWTAKQRANDLDRDGVANSDDLCVDTHANTTVGVSGCGLFDAVLTDVTFKTGSAWLTPIARGELDNVAQTLLAFPEVRVQVRAHTDNLGPADLNLDLSARRAEATVEYLVSLGVSELQLEAFGMGENQPIESNQTKGGQKANRRVDLVTLPNLGADSLAAAAAAENLAAPIEKADKQTAKKSAAGYGYIGFERDPVFPLMTGVKIAPLPKPIHIAGLSLGGVIEGVSFAPNSAELTESSVQVLREVKQELEKFSTVRVAIMAHTDNSGESKANRALSLQRATSVMDYLIVHGISNLRLVAEGYGELLPLVQNVTDADRARNRRIELRVLADQ